MGWVCLYQERSDFWPNKRAVGIGRSQHQFGVMDGSAGSVGSNVVLLTIEGTLPLCHTINPYLTGRKYPGL